MRNEGIVQPMLIKIINKLFVISRRRDEQDLCLTARQHGWPARINTPFITTIITRWNLDEQYFNIKTGLYFQPLNPTWNTRFNNLIIHLHADCNDFHSIIKDNHTTMWHIKNQTKNIMHNNGFCVDFVHLLHVFLMSHLLLFITCNTIWPLNDIYYWHLLLEIICLQP